jgi:hypothetical protein
MQKQKVRSVRDARFANETTGMTYPYCRQPTDHESFLLWPHSGHFYFDLTSENSTVDHMKQTA